MTNLQAVLHSSSLRSFLGKEVVENDRYHGHDSFKKMRFTKITNRNIEFETPNSVHSFLLEWIVITPNVVNKTFTLTLKTNPKYSILFSR